MRPARRFRPLHVLVGVFVVLTLVTGYLVVARATIAQRTTPLYDPPVLAGQVVPGYCSAGFYARRGETIVVTSSDHCATEGTVVDDPGTGTPLGVIGPSDRAASCPYPGYTCAASDMNYLVVAPDRIPWGHLNVVDLGLAGYRVLPSDTKPLGCADIRIGDAVEMDGRSLYRTGTVKDKRPNHSPVAQDGKYFPCMVVTDTQTGDGDSGGAVLVRGIPAGIVSRSFGGWLGFTPLAEGLSEMGLTLCTTPDCDVRRP